jgi:ribosomal protein S18 acetylase RimI-like enzyme
LLCVCLTKQLNLAGHSKREGNKEKGTTIINEMIFHTASEADIEELVTFVNNAYRGQAAEAGWASEANIIAGQRIDSGMLASMLTKDNLTILLMRDREHGPLAGCVSFEHTPGFSAGYLSMLSIDPQRQAEGLGRTLLSKAEGDLKAQGADRVRITVIWIRNTLIEWYERRGYRLTGEREPFPYGDQRFGVPLRDDLYFVVMEKPLP